MNKVYTRINWENYPSLVTPINEQNLNKLDFATDSLDNRIINLDTAKVNVTDIQQNIANWTMNEETGIITITRVNGDTITFDLNIEKIPVGFELTDEGMLIMTTDDGTQFKADIASMIPVLTFNNSNEIKVTATGTGKNKTYTFSIIDNSITEDKLEANYLANIKEETAKAEASSKVSSEASATATNKATLSKSWAVGGTGTRDNEDSDNAKYYAEQAKQIGQEIINDTDTTSTTTTFSANNISNLTNTEADSVVLTRMEETTENDLTTLNAFYSTTTSKKLNNYISSITGFLSQIVNSCNSLVIKVKSLLSVVGTSAVPTVDGVNTLTGLMYRIALFTYGTLEDGTSMNTLTTTYTDTPATGVYFLDENNTYTNVPSGITSERGIVMNIQSNNTGYYHYANLQTYASKSGIYMRYGTARNDWGDWVKLGSGASKVGKLTATKIFTQITGNKVLSGNILASQLKLTQAIFNRITGISITTANGFINVYHYSFDTNYDMILDVYNTSTSTQSSVKVFVTIYYLEV